MEEVKVPVNEYTVFVKYDEQNRLTALDSSLTLENPEGWEEIDRGAGDKYAHAQNHYLDGPIAEMCGIYRYKRGMDGKPLLRGEDELQADREAIPEPEPNPEQQAVRMLVAHGVFSDAEVSSIASALRPWRPGLAYVQGEYLNYAGQAYQVQQAHTAQAHQPPGSDGMLAIYRPVQAEPEEGEVLPWVSGEAVDQGDLREYQGVVYECIGAGGAGANVWTPDTVPAIWKAVE